MALPFFGASIPGFVGLLTGRGPFSPAFALIPGRSIRMSGSQVSSCQRAYTRAPPLGVGDTRACFSHRIAKDGRHDRDIHSLRQCHAMLRPQTLDRGNEIFGKTERPAPLVTHGSASPFRLQGNVSGHCRLMGAQSLTCLEYFARRLIRSVRPDRVRFVQSIDDGVSSGGFSQT